MSVYTRDRNKERKRERNRAKNYVETTNGAKNKTDKWK